MLLLVTREASYQNKPKKRNIELVIPTEIRKDDQFYLAFAVKHESCGYDAESVLSGVAEMMLTITIKYFLSCLDALLCNQICLKDQFYILEVKSVPPTLFPSLILIVLGEQE